MEYGNKKIKINKSNNSIEIHSVTFNEVKCQSSKAPGRNKSPQCVAAKRHGLSQQMALGDKSSRVCP